MVFYFSMLGQSAYHVIGEFSQDVFVGHDKLFGRLPVGDIGQNAQGLLFHVRTVLSFQNQYDGLHYLPAVLGHDQVNVRLGWQQIPQQAERLHNDADFVVRQESKHLICAQRR